MSESRVPRRVFGFRRYGMTGNWLKVHDEELHNSLRFANYY
jgi:hypothetical protein